MAFATITDVENRLGRPLTDGETLQVTEWLLDLEADIRERIPDVDDRIAGSASYERLVTRVVSETIVAKLRNPEGLRQTTTSIDDYSETKTIDSANSTGRLSISDADWGLLLPALDGDAYSIRLAPAPREGE